MLSSCTGSHGCRSLQHTQKLISEIYYIYIYILMRNCFSFVCVCVCGWVGAGVCFPLTCLLLPQSVIIKGQQTRLKINLLDMAQFGFNSLSQFLKNSCPHIHTHMNNCTWSYLRFLIQCVCVRVYYLRCIVTKWNMGTSPRLHGKSHNLSFDKDKQQNKHLKKN